MPSSTLLFGGATFSSAFLLWLVQPLLATTSRCRASRRCWRCSWTDDFNNLLQILK